MKKEKTEHVCVCVCEEGWRGEGVHASGKRHFTVVHLTTICRRKGANERRKDVNKVHKTTSFATWLKAI